MSTGSSSRRSPRRKRRRLAPPKGRRGLKTGSREADLRALPRLASGEAQDPVGEQARTNTRTEAGARESVAAILPAARNAAGEDTGNGGRRKKSAAPPQPPLKPEEKELKRKSAQLAVYEGELARQERRLTNLRTDLLPFEERYFRRIGVRCAQLDRIEADIAGIAARRNREDQAAQEEARQARERAKLSREAVRRKLFQGKIPPPAPIKRLYREVARRVHPDYGGDSTDRDVRERLMAHANSAYRQCNERRLRAIVSEYEFGPEAVRGQGTPLDLVRVIRRIAVVRGRLGEIDDEMERTESSELYRFLGRVREAEKSGRDLVAEVVKTLDARIAQARERRARMAAGRASGARESGEEEGKRARAGAFARGCAAE